MYLNGQPIFRKIIIPWYDSAIICIVMIILMSLVFFFGLIGISAALEKKEYHEYLWVPVILVVMSIILILSNLVRLFKRYFYRIKE